MRLPLALGIGLLTCAVAACASSAARETTTTMGGTVAPAEEGLRAARDTTLPAAKPTDSAAVKPVEAVGVVAADSAVSRTKFDMVVEYEVPDSMTEQLQRLDAGLTVSGGDGRLSARCERRELCILALNAANDVVRGGKSVEQARADYLDAKRRVEAGEAVPESKELRFEVRVPDPR